MRSNYRMLSLALLLGVSRAGLGQTTPALAHEDSVKGRIWTATARRVWTDEKTPSTATTWATGTDFNKWVLSPRSDKDELGSLWKAVLARVGQGKPATPTQVVQAILAEVSQRKTQKTGALAKVNLQALQVDLEPFVPAGSTTSAVVAATDSTPPTPAQPAGASRTVAEDENPAPEGQLPAAPTYTAQPLEPRYFGMPPGLAGTVLALLGAALGFGVASSRSKGKRHRHRHHAAPLAPVETEISSDMNPSEYRKLQNQNQQLRKELQQIKQQLADLQKQLTGVPTAPAVPAPAAAALISATSLAAAAAAAQAAEIQAPPTNTASVPPVANAETDDALFSVTLTVPKGISKSGAPTTEAVAQPAAPQPAATRYGPVQESAFLEERKIVDAPLPQLALMLTVNPRNPDQATFTLNPSVDQARLIGDGLTRLQKFFDYDPPLGGRITLVTAAAPGQLQRQADGWQVVQRARLNIS